LEIRFDRVNKTFRGAGGPVPALQDVSLSVQEGEFVCLVGPSGCGKSTLLSILAGFESPSSGAVTVDGRPVGGPSSDRVLMFQEAALFPWLSARANVEFGLKGLGLPVVERRRRAEVGLELVRLAGFGEAQPHELSGGMRQRVALARALAVEPRVLLMDEPFAALDAQTRDHLVAELERIWLERRPTVLFVTHNVAEAVTLGTRAIVMSARPGRVKLDLDLSRLERPRRLADPAVAAAVAAIQDELRGETGSADLAPALEAA
jgi:NitT/TauT family transport system ATP-binding protein